MVDSNRKNPKLHFSIRFTGSPKRSGSHPRSRNRQRSAELRLRKRKSTTKMTWCNWTMTNRSRSSSSRADSINNNKASQLCHTVTSLCLFSSLIIIMIVQNKRMTRHSNLLLSHGYEWRLYGIFAALFFLQYGTVVVLHKLLCMYTTRLLQYAFFLTVRYLSLFITLSHLGGFICLYLPAVGVGTGGGFFMPPILSSMAGL